jgi:hypothetical protein
VLALFAALLTAGTAANARYLAKDRFMILELDARFVTDDATMAALQAWIDKKRAGPAKP